MISYLVSLEERTSKIVKHNCSHVEKMHTIHLIWYKDTWSTLCSAKLSWRWPVLLLCLLA